MKKPKNFILYYKKKDKKIIIKFANEVTYAGSSYKKMIVDNTIKNENKILYHMVCQTLILYKEKNKDKMNSDYYFDLEALMIRAIKADKSDIQWMNKVSYEKIEELFEQYKKTHDHIKYIGEVFFGMPTTEKVKKIGTHPSQK